MDSSLTYVSKSLLTYPEDEGEIAAIVDIALKRNLFLHVTGALIATPHYFAQVLEGPHAAIDALMLSISRDSRHHDIHIVEKVDRDQRQFSKWSIAYSGYAHYVDKHISDFSKRADIDHAVSLRRLHRLMLEFTR
jgi:hypothetical protein